MPEVVYCAARSRALASKWFHCAAEKRSVSGTELRKTGPVTALLPQRIIGLHQLYACLLKLLVQTRLLCTFALWQLAGITSPVIQTAPQPQTEWWR